jgi:hypothetical protein
MKSRLREAVTIATYILTAMLLPAALANALSSGAGDRHLSEVERKHFLDGEFQIIKHIKDFPAPIAKALCQSGEMRSCMANPGEHFEATDFITDIHVPRRRLIFAGALDDKYFVYYEQGGYGSSHDLSFLKAPSSGAATILWRGHCSGTAANIDELRKSITSGTCWK